MKKDDLKYRAYIEILNRELIPAMGCTEPIAIAYTAAVARNTLGKEVDRVVVQASGNIIKNVKSVVVPNTGGKKGLEAAAAVGIIAGDPDKGLEVISDVSDEDIERLEPFMEAVPISVQHIVSEKALDALEITVEVYHGDESARVKVAKEHSNIILIEKNGEILYERGGQAAVSYDEAYYQLDMEDIYDFAETVDIRDIEEVIGRQIAYNSAISEEGLKNPYGANISMILLKMHGNSIENRAKAAAAAGSDARMSGCELPVIINSGSGNQGMTASLPVIEYAKELKVSKEKLYRALVLSNLATIYQKIHIGRLSAYCGAVSAGAGAGAGITYLLGGDLKHICHTIVNALAVTSGIICDGAKPSCAAKIAASVDAGILGYHMYKEGKEFLHGEGIVGRNIEETIKHIGLLASKGMKGTDEEIIDMMIHNR